MSFPAYPRHFRFTPRLRHFSGHARMSGSCQKPTSSRTFD